MNVEAGVDFLPGSSVLLVDSDAPAVKSSAPLKRQYGNTGSGVMNWGQTNALPQEIIMLCNQSPELLSLLDFYHTTLYGTGLYYEVYNGKDAQGKHTWTEGYDPEVEDWIKFNDINTYFLESCVDFSWFFHTFPELIKNKRGDKIAQITNQEAAFCRFGLQNQQGFNDKVYINANWPRASVADPLTIPVTAIDPYDLYKVQTVAKMADDKFILPVSYPTPGALVYQSPGWHSIFPAGWYDLSKLIPILKKAMMQFQMTIKFVIEVPQRFWEIKAEDQGKVWKDLLPNEKKAIKKSVLDEMNKFLTGAENAGKAFMSTFGIDPKTGAKIPGVTITPLDDKIKDGKYIEDGKEASGQFIRGMGIPVPLMGPISSGQMGAGSGSDVRIHENIFSNRLEPRRQRLLSPLNFIADYNGWSSRLPGFRWAVRRMSIDTLDLNHSTSNPTPSPRNNNPSDEQLD